MTRILACLFSLTVVLAAQVSPPVDIVQPSERGAIEGKVVSATTGLPLRKATVTVRSDGKDAVSAITDDKGKFVLENLESGDYFIKAKRVGYLDSGRAPVIRVSADQRVADFVLKLTPQGIVAGSVVDEDGDPVPGTTVTIKRFIGLGQKYAADVDSSNADGEGEFKFTGLKPGRYYLLAQPMYQPNTIETDHAVIETWYPDAIDPLGALPVTLTPGDEIRDIEIRLRKARVFSISGKVSGAPKGPRFLLSLTQNGRSVRGAPVRDGGFVFLNVLPGSYVIKTSPQMILETSGNTYTWSPPAVFCDFPVEVSDKNVESLIVPAMPAGDLTGQFKIDSPLPKTPPRVVLHGTVPLNTPRWPEAQAAGDGSFRIAAIPPDEYEPHVRDLPDGMYVKSMRYDGQTVTHGRIDLNSLTRGELEIYARIQRSRSGERHPQRRQRRSR